MNDLLTIQAVHVELKMKELAKETGPRTITTDFMMHRRNRDFHLVHFS